MSTKTTFACIQTELYQTIFHMNYPPQLKPTAY